MMIEPAADAPATLHRGDVVWAAPDPAVGREQAGRRPAVIVSSAGHLALATRLVFVVPVTSVERGWPNHVALSGRTLTLTDPSFAMTEQLKTIDRARIQRLAGQVDQATMTAIDRWVADFLDLAR